MAEKRSRLKIRDDGLRKILTDFLDEIATRFHIHSSQIVADFGESRSAKLSHNRPEFQKMIEMIGRGEANAILTWHPDRLSRNLGDVDTLIRLMEDRKLTTIITPQYMFGNAPLEKYILISECTRAKLENDNRGVNFRHFPKQKQLPRPSAIDPTPPQTPA
jgi:DNA invertase Pin-like site-specific DNA recombinase